MSIMTEIGRFEDLDGRTIVVRYGPGDVETSGPFRVDAEGFEVASQLLIGAMRRANGGLCLDCAGTVTIPLVAKADGDLGRLTERTGMSKTDITNRAISLYEFFDAQLRAGREILVRDRATGEAWRVELR